MFTQPLCVQMQPETMFLHAESMYCCRWLAFWYPGTMLSGLEAVFWQKQEPGLAKYEPDLVECPPGIAFRPLVVGLYAPGFACGELRMDLCSLVL